MKPTNHTHTIEYVALIVAIFLGTLALTVNPHERDTVLTMLRILIGGFFVYFGYLKLVVDKERYNTKYSSYFKKNGKPLLKFITHLELLGGILVIANILTTLFTAVFTILMSIAVYMRVTKRMAFQHHPSYYILLGTSSLILLILITGLGPY